IIFINQIRSPAWNRSSNINRYSKKLVIKNITLKGRAYTIFFKFIPLLPGKEFFLITNKIPLKAKSCPGMVYNDQVKILNKRIYRLMTKFIKSTLIPMNPHTRVQFLVPLRNGN